MCVCRHARAHSLRVRKEFHCQFLNPMPLYGKWLDYFFRVNTGEEYKGLWIFI